MDELEDWQRDLIEKIRVGVELKDDDIVKAMTSRSLRSLARDSSSDETRASLIEEFNDL